MCPQEHDDFLCVEVTLNKIWWVVDQWFSVVDIGFESAGAGAMSQELEPACYLVPKYAEPQSCIIPVHNQGIYKQVACRIQLKC